MEHNRQYKDSVFRMIFKEPENALKLFEGLTGQKASLDEIFVDQTGGLFTRELSHDVAFRVADRLIFLIEHQSSDNENMPIRMLVGIADLYRRYIKSFDGAAIYRRKLIRLPAPEFFIFCNGSSSATGKREMRLSDAFGGEGKNLELRAVQIDIRYSADNEFLPLCPILMEYSIFVDKVESGVKSGLNIGAAIREAVIYCIENDILKKFLEENAEEVQQAMLFEWNLEEALAVEREEALAEGREEGRKEGRAEGRAEGMGEGIKQGMEKGKLEERLSSIKHLMANAKLTAEKAMELIGIPADERTKYTRLL